MKQNLIVKITCNELYRKTRLSSLSINLLKIEIAKFMIRIHANNLLSPFCKLTDIHNSNLIL